MKDLKEKIYTSNIDVEIKEDDSIYIYVIFVSLGRLN